MLRLILLLVIILQSSANRNLSKNHLKIRCYDCLCVTQTQQCIVKQVELNDCIGRICGPYKIREEYWRESGALMNDWIQCSLNRYCAMATIDNYMKMHASDCNQNGRIDCDDYVLMHNFRNEQLCRKQVDTLVSEDEYYSCKKRLNVTMDSLQDLELFEDE